MDPHSDHECNGLVAKGQERRKITTSRLKWRILLCIALSLGAFVLVWLLVAGTFAILFRRHENSSIMAQPDHYSGSKYNSNPSVTSQSFGYPNADSEWRKQLSTENEKWVRKTAPVNLMTDDNESLLRKRKRRQDAAGTTDAEGCTSKTENACESTPTKLMALDLSCESGAPLQIEDGNYGRTDTTTCAEDNPDKQTMSTDKTDCVSTEALDKIKSICDQQVHCIVNSSDEFLGNPCDGVFKYLTVTYKCCPLTTTTEETTTEEPTEEPTTEEPTTEEPTEEPTTEEPTEESTTAAPLDCNPNRRKIKKAKVVAGEINAQVIVDDPNDKSSRSAAAIKRNAKNRKSPAASATSKGLKSATKRRRGDKETTPTPQQKRRGDANKLKKPPVTSASSSKKKLRNSVDLASDSVSNALTGIVRQRSGKPGSVPAESGSKLSRKVLKKVPKQAVNRNTVGSRTTQATERRWAVNRDGEELPPCQGKKQLKKVKITMGDPDATVTGTKGKAEVSVDDGNKRARKY